MTVVVAVVVAVRVGAGVGVGVVVAGVHVKELLTLFSRCMTKDMAQM